MGGEDQRQKKKKKRKYVGLDEKKKLAFIKGFQVL